eukprot:GHVP01028570.1.p1 GENE.GHVP01028570.1~~GHVP01028570.1.p1  ORF type:complete len:111 (+),score=3.08 GHVP01028570.1:241-573(+)
MNLTNWILSFKIRLSLIVLLSACISTKFLAEYVINSGSQYIHSHSLFHYGERPYLLLLNSGLLLDVVMTSLSRTEEALTFLRTLMPLAFMSSILSSTYIKGSSLRQKGTL